MKLNRVLFLLPIFVFLFDTVSFSQAFSQYRSGKVQRAYVPGIKDSLLIEVFLPREAEFSSAISFPVIFLFDKQNKNNYLYNLQTIDYLTGFANMPPAVLVGVEFPSAVRTKWTLPNNAKGKADSLLSYLFTSLRNQLEKSCKLSEFNILIGHSRTAMLSSYALAAFPDQVSAVIAASNSFFDFDTPEQQSLFENYIEQKKRVPGKVQHFYFSSGTDENGDAHDSSVSKLYSYMKERRFPVNFHWQHYQEKTPHMTVPGMTTGRALNDLFSPFTGALHQSFGVVKNQVQKDSVPWSAYQDIYRKASSVLGLELRRDLSFYNSIASAYLNDYTEQFKDRRFALASAVLEQGIKDYPGYPGFYSFLASIKLEQGEKQAAGKLLHQALLKLKNLHFANPDLLREEKESIDELLPLLK